MTVFANLSVTRKLVVYALLVGLLAVSLFFVIDFFYDRYHHRELFRDHLQSSADLSAQAIGLALSTDNQTVLAQILGALAAIPGVESAGVYALGGADLPAPQLVVSSSTQAGGGMLIEKLILIDRKPGAVLRLAVADRADGGMHAQKLVFALAALACTVLATALVASVLHRMVSRPLLSLTEFARTVSSSGEYSTRSNIDRPDEIGELATAMNDMLSEVEARDARLEEQVAARTTELIRLNEQLKYQAYHDALTRLPNRALFDDRLTLSMAQADRDKKKMAVLFLDLDNFKAVNDALGHDVGDDMLKLVAERLQRSVRRIDTVARLGGDEFTVILTRVDHENDVVSVLRAIVDSISEPMDLSGHRLHTSASIGISMYPEHGSSATALKRNADTAMYVAKARGRGEFRFYSSALEADSERQLLLVSDLEDGLRREELSLLYQPVVDASNGRCLEVEALMRWQHRKRGLMLPAAFMNFALDAGHMPRLQTTLLAQAMRDMSALPKAAAKPGLTFNLSAESLRDPLIASELIELATDAQFEPQRLGLELREADLLTCDDNALAALRDLAERGFRLVLDDFGSNLTAFQYLSRLPFEAVKLDPDLVVNIQDYPAKQTVIEAVMDLSKSMDFKVIAKAVETREQSNAVQALGCTMMQGFFYHEPMAPGELEELVRKTRLQSIA